MSPAMLLSGVPRACSSQLRSTQASKSLIAAPARPARRHRGPVAVQATALVNRSMAGTALSTRTLKDDAEVAYLTSRADTVEEYFPGALGVDDLLQRTEVALYEFGFTNENVIACINLCRDEITQILKHKIDQVYGSSFNINGLGAVLTCGATGMGAGLSHSPTEEGSGKERYVFFSFPHIAIDSAGMVGNVARPGRAVTSCACGALIKSLGEIKRDGLTCSCMVPGVHDPLDTEYSILKQRLARRLEFEGHTDATLDSLDLVELTKVAERTISTDLEFLISKAVDINKADYAVITGVQIHNWSTDFDNGEPNLEFVWPTSAYVVVNGEKIYLDLAAIPGLTPRQIRLLASAPDAHTPNRNTMQNMVCNGTSMGTLAEIDPPYMYSTKEARRKSQMRLQTYNQILMGNTLEQLPMVTPTPAAPMLLSPRVVKDTIDQSYWTEQDDEAFQQLMEVESSVMLLD